MNIERSYYLDCLRILCAYCVILIHTSMYEGKVMGTYNWFVANCYENMAWFSVPVFVMISGALFLSRQFLTKETILKIYRKNILRIVFIYFAWVLFYRLIGLVFQVVNDGLCFNLIISFLIDVLRGWFGDFSGSSHLWFLYMTVGLYVITPILSAVVSNRALLHYYIVISFIFGILIPFLQKLSFIGGSLDLVVAGLKINMVTGYTFYYVMGYYLHKNEIKYFVRNIIYLLGVIGVIVSVGATSMLSINLDHVRLAFTLPLAPNCVFIALAVFLFFKEHVSKISFTARSKKIIEKISGLTFGIYLVHMFSRTLLTIIGLEPLVFNTLISIPVICTLNFVFSFFLCLTMHSIPLLNRLI